MDNLYSVEKIFSENIFKIPDYQRGYAWEEQQCRDFLEDLELLEHDRQHFMGTLILQEADGDNNRLTDRGGRSYAYQEVIDGQQRLTTIVLFMLAIHNKMEALGLSDLTGDLRRNFLVTTDRNQQPVPKLHLNQDSDAFFRGVILGIEPSIAGPKIASERRLRQAKRQFSDYLDQQQQELGDRFLPWLEDLYFKVLQHLQLLIYNVGSSAEAGIVFETMNNRGKPITELEKVKNYLLYLAGHIELPDEHHLAQQINATWQHIFESLMAADLGTAAHEDQLLRAHWLMAYDYQTDNWEQSRSIKQQFDLRDYKDDHAALLRDVQTYLNSLRNACTAYCDILARQRHNAFGRFRDRPELRNQLQEATGRLQRIGARAAFLPLLMATLLKEDGPQALEALDDCERYAFRVYRWANRRSNTGQSTLYRLGYDLYQGSTSFTAVDTEMRRAIHRYCSDTRFIDRFSEEDNDWYHWGGLKYFLYEYEQYLAEKRGLAVLMPWEILTKKKDTIEHIMPQTLDRYGYWSQRFTPEEHQHWVHDIGNITLTYDNSALSNRPFSDVDDTIGKRSFYEDSKVFMEKQIAGHDDWTLAEIKKRREEIKAWALKRWHVEKPDPLPETASKSGGYRMSRIWTLAESYNIKTVLESVVDTCHANGIGTRAYKRSITLTPPGNKRYRLAFVSLRHDRLHVNIKYAQFPKFLPIAREEVEEILEPGQWHVINSSNIDEFTSRLAQVFELAGLSS